MDSEKENFDRGREDYRRGAMYDVNENEDWIDGWMYEFELEDLAWPILV